MNKNITGRTKRRQKRLKKKNLVKEDMEMNNEIQLSLNKSSKKKLKKFFTKKDIENFSTGKGSLNRMAGITNSNELLGAQFSAKPIYFKYGRDFLNSAYGKYGVVLKEQIVLTIKNGEEVYLNVSDVRKLLLKNNFKEIEEIKKPIKKNLKSDKILISYAISIEDGKNVSGHQNIILIDTVNKIVERFEPHGSYTTGYSKKTMGLIINSTYGMLEYLVSIMEEYTKKKYTIFNNYTTCPLIGLQGIQEMQMRRAIKMYKDSIKLIKDKNFRDFLTSSGFGYCQIWSLYYAEKRLQKKYRNIKTLKQRTDMITELIKDINKEGDGLSIMIHKYSQKLRLIARKINKFNEEQGKKSSRRSTGSFLSDSGSGMSSFDSADSS